MTQITYMGKPAVRVPYFDVDNEECSIRIRLSLEGGRQYRWRKGNKPLLYGLWRLPEARSNKQVILVEGESDCHTLWYHGVGAIGVPGCSTWKNEWSGHFEGIERIYVVIEPDEGGTRLLEALRSSPLASRLWVIRLEGFKDPSELHIANPEGFQVSWERACSQATSLEREIQAERAKAADSAYVLASHLLSSPRLLDYIREAVRQQDYAGDPCPPLLVYVAITSRLLEKPMHLALIGPSASGKNKAIDSVTPMFPNDQLLVLDASSERALIYSQRDFRNIAVIFSEADSIPDHGTAASAIRSIVSSGRLLYSTVVTDPKSNVPQTHEIEKEGPTVLITTSTRSVAHQLGTRLLEVPIADDVEQSRRVLRALAKGVARGTQSEPDLQDLIALQSWLQIAGGREVIVTFAHVLAEIVNANSVRVRRDFRQLLSCIQAIALLHQCQRERDSGGAIIASLDDYAVARDLLQDVFRAIESEGLSDALRDTLAMIDDESESTVTEIAKKCHISKSTASGRIRRLLVGGWIANKEPRKGHAYRLVRIGDVPDNPVGLPSVEQVRDLLEQEWPVSQDGNHSEVFGCSSCQQPPEDPPSPDDEQTEVPF